MRHGGVLQTVLGTVTGHHPAFFNSLDELRALIIRQGNQATLVQVTTWAHSGVTDILCKEFIQAGDYTTVIVLDIEEQRT